MKQPSSTYTCDNLTVIILMPILTTFHVFAAGV